MLWPCLSSRVGCQVKGKAAIDVLAARIGKSGGALVQQVWLEDIFRQNGATAYELNFPVGDRDRLRKHH